LIPLRIIHIVRIPQVGGSEVLVKNIINANNDSNVVHSLLYTIKGPLLDLIHESKQSNLIHCKYNNPLLYIFCLRQILKYQKTDIIHTHQPVDVIYALMAAVGLKVKIIRTYHGYEGINKDIPGFSLKNRILYLLINRFVCLNLFVSEALLNYYRSVNPGQPQNRQRILYNGIYLEDLKKYKTTNIRDELYISTESNLSGMIGGFNTRGRDHFTICKALKSALKNNPDLHFLFIGKTTGNLPELYNDCHNFCSKNGMFGNVHFIGERNDIGGLLSELDLYVHSSNHETFGIALVEAMISGVPCIASDIPPFREVSDNGKYVTLFEKGNADDLFNKIVMELKNIHSVKTIERTGKAKEFAEKNFSIQVHITNLHKFYRECLK
jgi:L-malate glycosyltransferase